MIPAQDNVRNLELVYSGVEKFGNFVFGHFYRLSQYLDEKISYNELLDSVINSHKEEADKAWIFYGKTYGRKHSQMNEMIDKIFLIRDALSTVESLARADIHKHGQLTAKVAEKKSYVLELLKSLDTVIKDLQNVVIGLAAQSCFGESEG